MMTGDVRLALFLSYVVLLFWRTRGATRNIPDDWWKYLAGYVALSLSLNVVQRIHNWWQLRRAVQAVRALNSHARQQTLEREHMWLSRESRLFEDRVRGEGVIEVVGASERFPFARGAVRAVTAAFWIAVTVGVALQGSLIVGSDKLTRWGGWLLFAGGTLCALLATWARKRMHHMETILEISPFSLMEVHPDGRKRVVKWGSSLLLRNENRWRRFELSVAGRPEFIAIDYERVGMARAFDLVLQHGGFERTGEDVTEPGRMGSGAE